VVLQLFGGLVALGAEVNIEPDMARSWEVLDGGLKYIFHLRDDLVWSDGVPLTAADYEFTWKRILDPATASPNAPFAYPIKGARDFHEGRVPDAQSVGVRATDDQTLEVELEQPTSYFLQLLAIGGGPVPRHVVESWGDAWTDPEHIVTSGPFRLAGLDPGKTIFLDSNPFHHGRSSGNVRQVVLSISETLDRVEAYEQDRLDMLTLRRLGPQEVDRLRQAHPDEYISGPTLWTLYMAFDTTRPPFDNRRVRRAFTMALDRERLAHVVRHGLDFPATGGLVPPGMPGHSPGISLPYDPEQARQLLAEVGFPGGQGFPTIEALNPQAPDDPAIAYCSTAWVTNLGIQVDWTFMPWMDVSERVRHRDLPHIWLGGWMADYADPDSFLRLGFKEWIGWRNQAFNRLIDEARKVADHARRMTLYQQADTILVEEAPIAPILYMRSHTLVKPWVRYAPPRLLVWPWKDFVIEPH
jgi:ABC-type oligopeptide transport system substrate-binding subunit